MSTPKNNLRAEQDSRAGCVSLRRCRATGQLVGVYRSLEAGLDTDPENQWATVCEVHGSILTSPTRRLASISATDPLEWCEDCRAAKGEPT